MKQIYLPPQVSLSIIAVVALVAGWLIVSTASALTPKESEFIQLDQ